MATFEQDLADILRHCRAMIDVADDVEAVVRVRAEDAERALRSWRGPKAEHFRTRQQAEALTARQCLDLLRNEADEWARVWAETVNEENRRRHQAAVDAVRARRGLGEQFVDLFVGDDSELHIAEVEPVAVPSAGQRYAPTGRLVDY